MLDEDEFARIEAVRRFCLEALDVEGIDAIPGALSIVLQPVLDEYELLTGYRETNVNAIAHHRLALQPPPCDVCGKPLQSSQARICGHCGASVGSAVTLELGATG
ncbi:MAG: hypothetical protein AAF533_28695 [Acidobacteriota bacterium]